MESKRILQIVRLVTAVMMLTGIIIFKQAKENNMQAAAHQNIQAAGF